MSKLYEALQQPGSRPMQPHPVAGGKAEPRLGSALRREMGALHQSIEAALPEPARKLVLFGASRPREGTSTIVQAFADMLTATLGAAVLIVDIDPEAPVRRDSGNTLPDLLQKLPVDAAGLAQLPGIRRVTWNPSAGTAGGSAQLLGPDQIEALRTNFDYTLLDAPAVSAYPPAVSLGPRVDGVVLLVEAGHTRWPVLDRARRAYEGSGAKILGAVLNKRRFHIPRAIYRWL